MDYVIPIENRGTKGVDLEFEPEGSWISLKSGERCELRLSVVEEQRLELSIEVSDESILFFSPAQKEVWRNGARVEGA